MVYKNLCLVLWGNVASALEVLTVKTIGELLLPTVVHEKSSHILLFPRDDYFKMKNEEKKQKRDVSIKEQQE